MTVVSDDISTAAAVAEVLAADPEDVPGVVEQLRRLQPVLERGPRGAEDGVACFNRFYERVIADIAEQLSERDRFRDPEFLSRLAVEFARRYVGAVRADASGAAVPRAWKVLFERRDDAGVGPMEFAVAGVNAHVNHDLPPAVVHTLTVLGRPGPGCAEHADHQALTAVFALHMVRLQDHFRTWLGREIDGTALDCLLDGAGNPGVVIARDSAWRRAEQLWTLRSRPAEFERECEAIDWRAAMIGRGVLSGVTS